MKKILFVCLGNICRSPAANGVFQKIIREKNLSGTLECDSCGTGNWHVGQLPDSRMRTAGTRRNYDFSHRARQLSKNDFKNFDLIIAMDDENFRDILSAAPANFDKGKLKIFTEFCSGKFANFYGVPDPYYGGEKEFELALDIIENGCENLLKFLMK